MRLKLTLVTGVVAILLTSCNGVNKAEYDSAAKQLCDCMAESNAESSSDDSEFNFDMTEVNYSVCVLNLKENVNIKDEQMTESIEEKCLDLKKTHVDYVKGL